MFRLSGLPASHQVRMLGQRLSDRVSLTDQYVAGTTEPLGDNLPERGNTPPPAYSDIFPDGYQPSPKEGSTDV